MASVTLRILIQLTLTLAALLGAQYSVFSWLTGSDAGPADPVTISPLGFVVFSGPRQAVEVQLRVVITALAFTALYVHEAFAYWIPKRNLLQFRKEYIDLEKDDWRRKLHPDIRINLMFARRRWYIFWLMPIFEWTWNDGFAPHHRDANLWMCTRQGACGKAFRTKTAQFASIEEGSYEALTWKEKWFLMNRYRLTKRQLSRTRHLRAVLSIPIVKRTEGLSPTYKAVGVINLDTETSAGAEQLEINQQELAEYFTKFGKILAELRG